MSSEMPETERDIELRRMLVATASAAPARFRRRWTIAAPIAAFAVAGALTGAVSAVALTARTAAPVTVDDPVTVANMIATLIHDDTLLFGAPVMIDGQADAEVPLGAMPEGAIELAVAVRCGDPGNYEVRVDGADAVIVACDEDSSSRAGGAAFVPVDAEGTHTLTVSVTEGDRFALWASWAARPVAPQPSPRQAAALADGEVSAEEYHAQFDLFAQCVADAGYRLGSVNKAGTFITYATPGEAVSSGADERCYALEFRDVDTAWQGAHR